MYGKRVFVLLISVVLVLSFALTSFSCMNVQKCDALSYNGVSVTVGEVTLPLEEYLPGSYFTKNGKACTCHYSSVNCLSGSAACNCIRYIKLENGETLDLCASQCIGFARYCFYLMFGFIDADYLGNSSKYYSVGSLSYGFVTASSVKALISSAKPGAHIRFNLGSAQHSAILLDIGNDGFTVYHANAGGDNVASSPCVVSTKYYSWQSFASFAYRGIVYVNLPYDYPGCSTGVTDIKHTVSQDYATGEYVTTDNLRLRSENTTESEELLIIPKQVRVNVTEVADGWGKTEYGDKTGWICLEYAAYVDKTDATETITTTDTTAAPVPTDEPAGYISGIDTLKNGLTNGFAPRVSLKSVLENADSRYSISVHDAKGSLVEDYSAFIATGMKICVSHNGRQEEMTAVVIGDTDCNGNVNVTDYLMLKSYMLKTYALEGCCFLAGDVNSDGIIDVTDYTIVKMHFLGLYKLL